MTQPPDSSRRPNSSGMRLLAIALALAAVAVAADFAWMQPQRAEASSAPREQATASAASDTATPYFPAQFTLHAEKEGADGGQAPSF